MIMKRLAFSMVLLLASCKDSGKTPSASPDAGPKEAMANAHDDFVKVVDAMRKKCGLALSVGRYGEAKGMVWKGKLVGMMKVPNEFDGQVQVTWVRGADGVWTCRDDDSLAVRILDGGPDVGSPCKLLADACGR